jgi:hypothetical protein
MGWAAICSKPGRLVLCQRGDPLLTDGPRGKEAAGIGALGSGGARGTGHEGEGRGRRWDARG